MYNIPGDLKLDFNAIILGDMVTGKIVMWDDPMIQALNPDVQLPSQKINVVGPGFYAIFNPLAFTSGITQTFLQYLAIYGNITVTPSPSFRESVITRLIENSYFRKSAIEMLYVVETLEYTISVVSLDAIFTSVSNKLQVGRVVNKAGNAIYPTVQSLQAAMKQEDLPL